MSFSHVYAQKEGNIWYFGVNAGLDFNSGAPVALTDGQLYTDEGCATICDKNGKLLFYTDGTIVWNSAHKEMPNGFSLLGNSSSTQSAVIVPFPGDTTKYYIFTVPALASPDGLNYSVVDLTKDNGKGDVTIKNIHLENLVCEKLTAVNHDNGQDIWVIAHLWESDQFVAYLVTPKGIGKPVYTSVGPYYGGDDASTSIGYLKASPDGKRIAAVRFNFAFAECQVYDFNNKSGEIYNPVLIDSVKKGYGVEFSPDSRLLYVGHGGHREGICKIFQYDLELKDTAKIKNSGYLVVEGLEGTGALQLGPDKKIYLAQNFIPYLHTIENPNERGSKCNFVLNTTSLHGKFSTLGLPTFIQSYFETKTDFSCQYFCLGTATQFKGFSKLKPGKWEWDFGDLSSGKNNTSNAKEPVHIFTVAGKYRVKLTITSGNFSDRVEKEVVVYETPKAKLGEDITTCDTLPIALFAGEAEYYKWSTGDTTKQISVTKTGIYWVSLKNASCTAADTIHVTFLQERDFEIGNDTTICAGDSITLKSNISKAKYMWSTGSQDSAITVNKPGKYWLATLINDCIKADTISIKVIPLPTVDLGKDTFLCEGDEIELNANNTGAQFIWNTGENTQTIKARNAGRYWVTVNSNNCLSADTITLKICPPNVYVPNAFTPDDDSTNDVFRVYSTDIAEAELKIYNRWGECVFDTKDLTQGWNGTFKNHLCPVDRYVWLLRYKGKIAPQAYFKELTGTVSLIR